MSQITRGQVSANAAEVYESFYLPALFQEWAPRVADAARVEAGQRVLDVACGTGVLARELSRRVGDGGSVTGLDVNEGMLAVARRTAPGIDWRLGVAEALPFEDASFDAVLSQFGLMFFEDRVAAIRQMLRVVRPGGRLAVAVWDTLDHSPGYAAFVSLLQRLFGEETAAALRAPFVLGDLRALRSLFVEAGAGNPEIATHMGTARFPSIRSWVYTEAKGWTTADMIDDPGYERLLVEAEHELRPFAPAEGPVAFAAPGHIVSVTKP